MRKGFIHARVRSLTQNAGIFAEVQKLTIAGSISGSLLLLIFFATSALAVNPRNHISQYAHSVWRVQDGFFNGPPNAITQTTDGYIWIGTPAGLFRFDGVRFVPWTPPPGESFYSSNQIYDLVGGKDGSLWIGTGSNLVRLKDNHLVNYSKGLGRINFI